MLTQVLPALHPVDHAKHGKFLICYYAGSRNRLVDESDIPVQFHYQETPENEIVGLAIGLIVPVQVPSQTVYAFHNAGNIWKVDQSDN